MLKLLHQNRTETCVAGLCLCDAEVRGLAARSKRDLSGLATPDLVALFTKIVVEQDEALLSNRIARFNRLSA